MKKFKLKKKYKRLIFNILISLLVLVFLFSMYKFSDGNLRLYIFLGLGFGIVIYMLSLSKFIINMLVCIIKFFQKIFQKVINILKIPYSFGYKFIAKIIHFFTRKLQINSTKKIKKNTKKCKLFRGKSKQMENNNIGIV